jgi:transcriptional regulator with XRE-family HTH domain
MNFMQQKTGIGERIRIERERLGFSQMAFAGLGEASKNSQLAWEKETAFPNARVLNAWARAGADVGFIVTGRISGAALPPKAHTMLELFLAADDAAQGAALGALLGAGGKPLQTQSQGVHLTNHGHGAVQIGGVAGNVSHTVKRK